MTRVSVLGSGVVGTAIGKGLSQLGNEVIFYDVDLGKVRLLSSSGLAATSQIKEAVERSEISFICVPTPLMKRGMDLSCVKSLVRALAACLKRRDGYHLVVMKSTVLPMTTEAVVIPLLEKVSGKEVGECIGVCVNPEFLTEIHGTWTDSDEFCRSFFNEDRIVIGEFDRRSGDLLESLYSSLKTQIVRTDLKTAELIKFASNCALASRISYWNEIFYVCQRLGVNSDTVTRTVAMDKRIGKYGTIHGKAFGGKCLPKDLGAFIGFCRKLGYEPKLLKATREVNERIRADRGARD